MSSLFRHRARTHPAVLLGLAGLALGASSEAAAQTMTSQTAAPKPVLASLSPSEISTLPPEDRREPVLADRTETTIDADIVETITRTRFIPAQSAALS